MNREDWIHYGARPHAGPNSLSLRAEGQAGWNQKPETGPSICRPAETCTARCLVIATVAVGFRSGTSWNVRDRRRTIFPLADVAGDCACSSCNSGRADTVRPATTIDERSGKRRSSGSASPLATAATEAEPSWTGPTRQTGPSLRERCLWVALETRPSRHGTPWPAA